MNAVFATDAKLGIDDHRSLFVFGDCFHRTNRGAGGKVAMHTAIARPQWRESFEHRRFDGDPIRAGQLVEGCAGMVVPVFAGLDAMAAADAPRRRSEEHTSD